MLATLGLMALTALAPTSPDPDPYEGVYACTPDSRAVVFWMGDWKRMDYHRRFSVYGAYPYGTALRVESGGRYRTRGGYNDLAAITEFKGSTFYFDDEACTTVTTLRELVRALGFDPTELAQEIMDLEGWTAAQTDGRLDDPDYLHPLLNIEDAISHPLSSLATRVPLGETVGAVPPADPAPSGAPEYAHAFEGLYVNARSSPRLFLVRDGRYVQFSREWDDDHPAYDYAYELEDAYDYTARGGTFAYKYTDTEFEAEGDRVVRLVYRNAESPRVYTLRDVIEVNEWDAADALAYLMDEHGMSEADADARLDDAAHLDRVVRETDAPLTFAVLAGVAD